MRSSPVISPACAPTRHRSVHALEVDKLRSPDIKFWSVWSGEQIVGCGALKRLDPRRGELKSMRVADAFLSSLWLETGSGPAFEPALRLYESAGFSRCGPSTDTSRIRSAFS